VRGATGQRLLTDIVSLVRFALHQDGELVPHVERVRERFQHWLAQQESKGRTFSEEQKQWLGMMRDHIATSLEVDMDSFDLTPFAKEGGLARASKVFGKDLEAVVEELNKALAA
jgi:type I restriction enzyme R subunit